MMEEQSQSQISQKVQGKIRDESSLFEQAMASFRDAHWQSRVIEALKQVDALEEENNYLRNRLEELTAEDAKVDPEEIDGVVDAPEPAAKAPVKKPAAPAKDKDN